MFEAHTARVHFGGPELPPRALRNLLEEYVHGVPAGGSIDWVTYYFRDRKLADALVAARRRGVAVRVTVDARPRTAHANDRVAALLSNGLGTGFRAIRMPRPPSPSGTFWTPHLHEKLYCFSHPVPVVFVGSFNPSGDEPEEEPEVLEEIRDQDRGHNLLVGLREPSLVRGLLQHARWVHGTRSPGLLGSLSQANRTLACGSTEVYFLPRIGPHPVVRFLRSLGSTAGVRIAGSHIKGAGVVRVLSQLTRRVASVQVVAEETTRRVPAAVEERLRSAGVVFHRLVRSDGLPMHNKFLLVEEGGRRWVIFGSFNWTTRSLWINREICVLSEQESLCEQFSQRWADLERG